MVAVDEEEVQMGGIGGLLVSFLLTRLSDETSVRYGQSVDHGYR